MIYKANNVISWASDIDHKAIVQAERTARLPIVHGHVALMPDAHVGLGATVGSVVATKAAVIPAAVGVDIGCGMIAVETDLKAHQLPDDLGILMPEIERSVPAGVGQGHQEATKAAHAWFGANEPTVRVQGDPGLLKKALQQFGSLGSGNHFFEICLDGEDTVWVVLHSGSRGVGNKLAERHIKVAQRLAQDSGISLEDKDLAWLQESTPEFEYYIEDMLWSQHYAMGNRDAMMSSALRSIFAKLGIGTEVRRINCHHNFCQQEHHGGHDVWVTRKGAIRARTGDLGVIPGSMGTRSYIVRGRGSSLSWESCSHGAGRRHSRSEAKKIFSVDDLAEQMKGKVWLDTKAEALVDEIPSAYKDIDQVMADQEDLVEIEAVLTQILNYKGTK